MTGITLVDKEMRETVLKGLRPGNETQEHFMLKQVAKKWLYEKGVNFIGTEVYVESEEESPYGRKKIVDVVGVQEKIIRPFNSELTRRMKKWEEESSIDKTYIELFRRHPLSVSDFMVREGWEEEKREIEKVLKDSGKTLDWLVHTLMNRRKTKYTLFTMEAKASLSDFKNGFSVAGDYSYVIAPAGIIKKELIPDGVGLIEVDMERVLSGGDYNINMVTHTKRVKRAMNGRFLTSEGKVNELYREYEMEEIKNQISRRNVNESHYWNPHLT